MTSIAPQNTLAAGRAAFAIGADVWGVDVRRTADGVFVLMHDATLERTTNVEEVFPDRAPWPVDAFTLDEIRRLDAGSWFVDKDRLPPRFAPIARGGSGELQDVWLERWNAYAKDYREQTDH